MKTSRLALLSDRYPGELKCEWHWREWRTKQIVADIVRRLHDDT